MPQFIRKFSKKILVFFTCVLAVLTLLANANAFLHPDHWWLIALLGLAYPFLILLMFLLFLSWLFFRSKWAILPAAILVLSYSNIRALAGFHLPGKFNPKKEKGSFRVLSWNVRWFDAQQKGRGEKSYRKKMLEFIAGQNADVLCFQEYLEPNMGVDGKKFTRQTLEEMGYPYHFIAGDYYYRNGYYNVGVSIFSRYPISDTIRLQYPGPSTQRAAESLIGADIRVGDQAVRVFTTHLQSILLRKNDYRNLEIIRKAEDSLLDATRSILRKLKLGYSYRGYQADLVRNQLDESPFPVIMAGDFNDVPNSYTYFRIRGDRKDAFISTGLGLGRTFSHLSPTLRIDYLLCDPEIEIVNYHREILPYSDHYPILADFRLPGKSE